MHYIWKFGAVAAFITISMPLARAHEVHASTVSVTLKDNKLEVLQTTPARAAKNVSEALKGVELQENEEILNAMALGWAVTSGSNTCSLKKQAYRMVHHLTQMQFRFLFECSDGEAPMTLSAPWLMKAPADHFMTTSIHVGEKSTTVIFQRQPIVIDLSEPTFARLVSGQQ